MKTCFGSKLNVGKGKAGKLITSGTATQCFGPKPATAIRNWPECRTAGLEGQANFCQHCRAKLPVGAQNWQR